MFRRAQRSIRSAVRSVCDQRIYLAEAMEERMLLSGGALLPGAVCPVGSNPQCVAIADLNGDGKQDLVTANYGSDTVSVLLGNGDGTFAGQQTFAVASGPVSVAIADLNGDGKQDLVTTNYNSSGTVSVLLGNGNGTFQTRQTFAVGRYPFSVAIADLNGDGKQDLAAANAGSNTVSVLLGNGDGTFAAQQTFAVGTGPLSVAIADLNGDGRQDLVTANSGSNTVSVLLGNGDGTFAAQQISAVNSNPQSVAIADLNGDVKQDLVTGNWGSNTVSVLLGNGDGTFAAQQTFAFSGSPQCVAIADLNGDGKQDLVAANGSSATSALGNGNGTFAAQQTFAVGGHPVSVAIADLNGDGKKDLVTADYSSNTVSALLGNGNGSFATRQTFAVGSSPQSVAIADLNGDGRQDLVTANNGSNTVSVLLGNGDGTFAVQHTFTVASGPVSVAIADLNGDGKQDLVTTNYNSSGTVSVLLGNGNGTFQTRQTFAVGRYPFSVAIADLNGDGKQDLAAANAGSNTVSVLLGNGDGTFAAQQTFSVGTDPNSVAIADLNGDGKKDVVTANYGSSTVSVLLGNGNGTFAAQQTFSVGTDPNSLAIADVNGDGKQDLVTANYGSNNVSVLLGNGDGTFQTQQVFTVGTIPCAVAIADLNGDGKQDLVTANNGSNTVSVLLGNGNGTFAAERAFAVNGRPYSVAIADLNGDGKKDLVIPVQSVNVLLNQSNSPPIIDSVGITPTGPKTTQTLTANVTSHDADGDTVSYRYQWNKNGNPLTGQTGSTLDLSVPGNGDKGDSITVTVTPNDGTVDGARVTSGPVTVMNTAPVIDTVGITQTGPTTNQTLTPNVTSHDVDDDTVSYRYQWSKNGNPLTGQTGSTLDLSVAGNGDKGDVITVTVTPNDGTANGTAVTSGPVTVINTPPAIADVPAGAIIDEEVAYTFTASATDPDAPPQTLSLSLVDAPSGAAIDPATGVFNWTPTESQGPGVFNFKVRVSDGEANTDAPITLTVREVNVAPVLAAIGNKTVAEEKLLTFTATATDHDIPVQTLTFSLAGNIPAGASIDPSTGVFTWTPTGAQGPASYTFDVVVSDGSLTDSETITVTVTDATPPTSAVQALPVTESTTKFTVAWSGQDDAGGSGLASYGVFVSDNGGSFQPWLAGVTATSAIFGGQPLHSYAFYSIARDNAGNVEDPPATPDAQTFVAAVNGTSGDDTIRLRVDPANGSLLQVFMHDPPGDVPEYGIALAALPSLTIRGLAGNDTMVVDMSYGNPIPAGGLTFDGSDGINSLIFKGLSGDQTITASPLSIGGRTINYSGIEEIGFADGSVNIASTAGMGLVATDTATVNLTGSMTLPALDISGAARVNLTAGGDKVLRTGGLAILADATLDLNDGAMVVESSAGSRDQDLATVAGLIVRGRSGGTWMGTGLISGIAAQDAVGITGLAAIINEDGNGMPIRPELDGNTNAILVEYTFNGDSELNGKIDANDYFQIDQGYRLQGDPAFRGYQHGDFDYSGSVTADDYYLIDRAFLHQSGVLSGGINPSSLTVFNNKLYFAANDGTTGPSLWQYDGTGATLVPGTAGINPTSLTVVGSTLYFAATSASQGTEVWKYDGSTAAIAADINPGSASSNPGNLSAFNGLLYFSATGSDGKTQLWRLQGTQASPVSDSPSPSGLDTAFGTGGEVITPGARGFTDSWSVALQPDGKIIVATTASNGSNYDFALARYTTSGALDTTFGSGGLAFADFGRDEYAQSVALQPDGSIIVVGYTHSSGYFAFALARFTSSGILDTTFGGDNNGMVTMKIGTGTDRLYSVALQPDGKIIAAGSGVKANGSGTYDFVVARFTTAGILDTSFGSGGVVVQDFAGEQDYAYAVAVQPDGKIVAAGDWYAGGVNPNFAVDRFTATGALDTSFTGNAGAGRAYADFTGRPDYARALALQPDGKIIVAGEAQTGASGELIDFALARFTATGALDTTFGPNHNGKVLTNLGLDESIKSIVVQPDGKIIAVGTGGGMFHLARYTATGDLDTTFGSAGTLIADVAGSGQTSGAYGVALQPDGRIVVAGFANTTAGLTGTALVRYAGDGTPLNPRSLTTLGGNLYFAATSGSVNQIYRSDGMLQSAGGVTVPLTANTGTINYNPTGVTAFNGALYFAANDAVGVVSLWKYDPATTSMSPVPGTSGLNPSSITVVGNTLYFAGTDSHGTELWQYTGSGSASRITDINPGAGSSNPTDLVGFGGCLYFVARNSATGVQFYQYGGSGSPVKVMDIDTAATGTVHAYPVAWGGGLYLVATDSAGTELWRYLPAAAAAAAAPLSGDSKIDGAVWA